MPPAPIRSKRLLTSLVPGSTTLVHTIKQKGNVRNKNDRTYDTPLTERRNGHYDKSCESTKNRNKTKRVDISNKVIPYEYESSTWTRESKGFKIKLRQITHISQLVHSETRPSLCSTRDTGRLGHKTFSLLCVDPWTFRSTSFPDAVLSRVTVHTPVCRVPLRPRVPSPSSHHPLLLRPRS